MAATADTTSGWYVRGFDGTAEWQRGPYAWTELVSFAQDGRLQPHNTAWHESRPEWVTADTLPGLFAQAVPVAVEPAVAIVLPPAAPVAAQPTPEPAPAAPQPGPDAQPASAPPKRRGGPIALVAALLVVLIGGGAFAGWWFLLRDGGSGDGPTMGAADTTLPDSAALVTTVEWGAVPANQLLMMMTEDGSRSDAEKAANSFGGTLVGEVAFVGLYQVQFDSATEDELRAAIASAEGADGVDYAYPLTQVTLDAEIWGVRLDPYSDPVYGGGAGDGYKAVGVSKAWSYIRGAGVDLSKVKVGVVDDGIYRPGEGAENEFDGSINVEFPDAQAGELIGPKVSNGAVNPAGSHGTGVSTIIGANPDNGGATGVAGPLGDKLTISMINQFSSKYGDTTSTPDPNDPTKQLWHNGTTYSIGSLVALTKQIEAGATVINCSWGNSNADPKDVETYKRFFTKMAEKHPDVLFVCSGGNGGKEMDGSKRYPSGLALPNMITVGALDNDGKQAEYADSASDDYEVTLGAPGTGAVVGIGANGGAVQQDGSSFAAPHVTAAAAILKSLNPKLTAGEIKQILVETARDGVPSTSSDPGATSNLIPAGMGGKILALDQAVLKVINDLREAKGLDPFDEEMLAQLGVVDAVAVTGAAGEYTVKGIVEATGEKGADLKIEVYGEDYAIGGKTEQSLSGAGEAEWSVTLPDDKGSIVVTRLDSGAKSVITIEEIDINGHWDGTFTFTKVVIDPSLSEQEGCTAEILQSLVGTPVPMTLDLTVGEDGQGSGTMFINFNTVMEDADSEPTAVVISYTGTSVAITPADSAGPMTAQVSRSGDTLQMSGEMVMVSGGWDIAAVFNLSKPVPTE